MNSQLLRLNNVYRQMSTMKFANTIEEIAKCNDYPKIKIQKFFRYTTFSILGYGPQGRSQALNLLDNGLSVLIGLRPGNSYDEAIKDGFVPNINLFTIEEATTKGDIIMNLLSDAGQKQTWEKSVLPYLNHKKTLYFSHGFSIIYKDQTKVIPPPDMDVIMVAPKGSGRTLRTSFMNGKGVNSSIAVYHDSSGKAEELAKHIGFAIGSGYLYKTTFDKEVHSDLVGERGVLMGAIHGLFLAQYNVLRERGHSPSESFNETVEELTQSLMPLIDEQGMDWMYKNCSTTAQRGAIDWYPKFEKVLKPLMNELYDSVHNGTEVKNVLEQNNQDDYRTKLDEELKTISNMEIWQVGKTVRELRKLPKLSK
jgi:ketol-acid reductoisomerase